MSFLYFFRVIFMSSLSSYVSPSLPFSFIIYLSCLSIHFYCFSFFVQFSPRHSFVHVCSFNVYKFYCLSVFVTFPALFFSTSSFLSFKFALISYYFLYTKHFLYFIFISSCFLFGSLFFLQISIPFPFPISFQYPSFLPGFHIIYTVFSCSFPNFLIHFVYLRTFSPIFLSLQSYSPSPSSNIFDFLPFFVISASTVSFSSPTFPKMQLWASERY